MVCLPKIVRHKTHSVRVGNITIGGNAPIVIQSMTNTDTTNIEATTQQIIDLAEAGSEIVRITVNNDGAAKAVPYIYENLLKKGYNVPLAGCFHYNGHQLLTQHTGCAQSLAKYRINPGNVGFGKKRDQQFEMMIETALKNDKPIRIGVNWGSLDKAISARLMDENAKSLTPKTSDEILRESLIESALSSAKHAEHIGLPPSKIIVSCKVSRVQDLICVYRELAQRSNYALHLGLTEAGMGTKGVVATTAALSTLLQEGIGDTIRTSLTPRPNQSRTEEVIICKEILQTMGFRAFTPQVSACPGCGRTTSKFFQELALKIETFLQQMMPQWKTDYPGVENLHIAVMGCIVNGPGESKHADIGISLPGTGEQPIAPVFMDGKKTHTLRGENIAEDFQNIVETYIQKKFQRKTA